MSPCRQRRDVQGLMICWTVMGPNSGPLEGELELAIAVEFATEYRLVDLSRVTQTEQMVGEWWETNRGKGSLIT